MSVPDVSVVVAVYNTMPYLTECLTSLVQQTIGLDRLEVIAVDDGSTDGGGEELDRWAERYPGTIKVLHQANSGGPAKPSNRALDIATGRYVFFIGADDHLGPEAMQRLVATADKLDADIVLGRMVGAGGRYVNQAVYKPGNKNSITLADSALPWALSNTKLFRRSMIEENGIRYPEQLRSYSDQPFTLRAVVAARRIAVRADYDFYYAVRRQDDSNITYGTPVTRFLQDAEVVMDTVADVVTDPESRHRVLRRNFTWEVYKLVSARFVAAGPEERRQVHEGVRKLAEAYLTEEMRASLDVHRRVPISIAQHGSLEDLEAVAEHYAEHGLGPLVIEGDRYYVAFPGFRDPAKDFPDAWFEATAGESSAAVQREPATVTLGEGVLRLEWHSHLPALGPGASVSIGSQKARSLTAEPVDGGLRIRAEFALTDLAASWKGRPVKFRHSAAEPAITRDLTVIPPAVVTVRYRNGLRFYTVALRTNSKARLTVVVSTFGPRRLAGRLVRKLRPVLGPRQGGKTPA
ncbi:glycosyltransferase [Actinoplanes sp. NBC_00393]|uniref:glycosyltransferase n=1 Tax=Actinoplanes sp. NBC_00393 TaxID=2975953 RepID=UPI002E240623